MIFDGKARVIPTCSTRWPPSSQASSESRRGSARPGPSARARLDLASDADLTRRVRDLVERFVAVGLVEAARLSEAGCAVPPSSPRARAAAPTWTPGRSWCASRRRSPRSPRRCALLTGISAWTRAAAWPTSRVSVAARRDRWGCAGGGDNRSWSISMSASLRAPAHRHGGADAGVEHQLVRRHPGQSVRDDPRRGARARPAGPRPARRQRGRQEHVMRRPGPARLAALLRTSSPSFVPPTGRWIHGRGPSASRTSRLHRGDPRLGPRRAA